MARSLCGVPGLTNGGSAHSRAGSETTDVQRSKHAPCALELEALCCSLDSLGAFTDEHYCGPAVTRSMHSDDTHSQMWVGSGLTSKAQGPDYSNFPRDSTAPMEKMSLLMLTSVAALY